MLISPIPQNEDYHNFADQRTLIGIPNFLNVVTNAAFILVGLHGLWLIYTKKYRGRAFESLCELPAYLLFFLGLALTGMGSGWYHIDPTTKSLFWDRLPMTLATERLNSSLGPKLLWGMVLLGAASVIYWRYSEELLAGDLRAYAFVQFYPMLAIPLILLLFPSRYTKSHYFWVLFVCYGFAKILEGLDEQIYSLHHIVSGHSLKHLFAALGAWWVVLMLLKRHPLQESSQQV